MPNNKKTKKTMQNKAEKDLKNVAKRMIFEKLAMREDGTNMLPKPLDTYSDEHINKVLDNFNIKVNF